MSTENSNSAPDDDIIVKGPELASILDINNNTLRDLTNRGIVKKLSEKRYLLKASCRGYIGWLKTGATSANTPKLGEQRARLAKAQADKAELLAAREAGDAVTKAEAEAVLVTLSRQVRARMLALVSRMRSLIPKMTASEADLFDREIRDALTELSNAEPTG